MVLISHRGNLNGPNHERENHPDYIMEAYRAGFNVEIDVWEIKNKFFLGHDKPQYEVDWRFLTNGAFWCHAKNFDALHSMRNCGAHCFWHQNDSYTLTSKGYIWTYPGMSVGRESIIVCNSMEETVLMSKKRMHAVCSDYVGEL